MKLRPYISNFGIILENEKVIGQTDPLEPETQPSVSLTSDYAESYFCTTSQTITFLATVISGGTEPIYQWYNNNTLISNSTYSALTINDTGFVVQLKVINQSLTGSSNTISVSHKDTFSASISYDTQPQPHWTAVVTPTGQYTYAWRYYKGDYPNYGENYTTIGSADVLYESSFDGMHSGTLNLGEPGYPGTWQDCLELVVTNNLGTYCNATSGSGWCQPV